MESTVTLDSTASPPGAGEILDRIAVLKRQLGRKLLVLGHHYQVDEIIRFADVTGDSFKLARYAAERRDAEYVIMCGVHFMAESVDILAGPDQRVMLPDFAAGCSMADMANLDQVETAFEVLAGGAGAGTSAGGAGAGIIPITYMNSSAAIKAFCGRNGGAVCTSSNAAKLIPWAFGRQPRILFLPDQHLGRNVGFRLGIPLEDMALWDPHALPEENLAAGCDRARLVLWKGHCSVHTKFLPQHVDAVRARWPGIHVIVHPECVFDVVRKADSFGSTERIIAAVEAGPPGSRWAVGTEINLVSRLAKAHPDKLVVSLSGINCLCSTMYRIDPPHLLRTLENLAEGRVVNEIVVDDATARDARAALDRMLANA